ncbi:hypothetical protein C7B62_22995 [Pleurocapsa sp. CCALA 161]|nr:hypothetical protein C7B62_22995 [Pleurocapsa sp. CCALA 161]
MLDIIQPKIRKIIRNINRINDNNFIGFDKYAKKGAYHWEELAKDKYYRAKVEIVSSYLSNEHILYISRNSQNFSAIQLNLKH